MRYRVIWSESAMLDNPACGFANFNKWKDANRYCEHTLAAYAHSKGWLWFINLETNQREEFKIGE